MKKMLLLVLILLSFMQYMQAQEEIVKWTFPTGQLGDTVQNSTNALNLTRTIRVEGTDAITMTNGVTTGDYAATATGWDGGMDLKNWNIKFKTTGYDQVKISSKQRAGGSNGGPVDFKIQYKTGSTGAWADVPGGSVTLGNNWTSGVISNLDLPAACQNQSSSVYIRWIMTSNTDILGGTVAATGISKIDEIIVKGILLTGMTDEQGMPALRTFPNPSSSAFSIGLPDETSEAGIYNNNGQLVYKAIPVDETLFIDKPLPSGLYYVKATTKGRVVFVKHIVM